MIVAAAFAVPTPVTTQHTLPVGPQIAIALRKRQYLIQIFALDPILKFTRLVSRPRRVRTL